MLNPQMNPILFTIFTKRMFIKSNYDAVSRFPSKSRGLERSLVLFKQVRERSSNSLIFQLELTTLCRHLWRDLLNRPHIPCWIKVSLSLSGAQSSPESHSK